jgi:hypothetical protein
MATVAVFITLGGGAYAATTLKANSVGGAQLKNGAVTNKKLAKNAVTGAKVKDGSLLAADFAPGQVPAGPAGAKGDPGLKGDKGDTGAPGAPGTARAYAPFALDGTISPTNGVDPIGGSALGLTQADETAHVASSGQYCFHPSFTPKSASVTAMGDLALASSNFINATVTVRTSNGLSGCGATDTVRVRTYLIPSGGSYQPPSLTDEPFILWLE